MLPTHQIFKLDVQVLSDGELRVRNGLVKVRVQIVQHLKREQRYASDQRRVATRQTSGRLHAAQCPLTARSDCTHRFDGLQQLDAVFLNVAVRVGELDKRLTGRGLRFPYADDRKNIPEGWIDPAEITF